jgi:hypothetical protein
MDRLLGFRALLVLSSGLAIASFLVPCIPFVLQQVGLNVNSLFIVLIPLGLLFAVAWVVALVIGLARYGTRALWMALGAPLVAVWPIVWSLYLMFRGT